MSNEIHQGILSVRWFAGVQSSDSASTTARLQAALDHPTDDAILFNSNGGATIYTVTGLTISRPRRIIIDRGVTVKLANLSNTSLFTIGTDNVTIEGEGTLDGNRANQTSGHGVTANGYNNIKIEGLNLQEMEESGIYLLNGSRLWVRECRVATTGGSGVFIRSTTAGSDMEDCRVIGCYVDRSDAAGNNEKCIALTRDIGGRNITYSLIQGNRAKMHASPSGANVVCIEVYASDVLSGIAHARVSANATEGGEIGLSIASRAQHCSIQDNVAYNASSIGLEIADALYCSIQGNTVDGNDSTDTGIVVDGTNVDAVGCTVTGNTVRRIATGGQGIYSIAGTPYLSIVGNSVVLATANSTGIRINGSDDVRITGNSLDGSTTAGVGITVQNSNRVDIGENTVRRWANFAIQAAANATTVTGLRVDESNRLNGTNGDIQILEQNGGVYTDVVVPGRTVTPAQITADQTAYNPGREEIVRISSNAAWSIHGIANGVAGRHLYFLNVGANEITLPDESSTEGTAANRIDTGTGAAVLLLAGDCAHLLYDGTSFRWRVVGTN